MAQALLALDAYPALLRLHLNANYPKREFKKWRLDELRSERFRKSEILKSMLVVAWLTAQPALDVSSLSPIPCCYWTRAAQFQKGPIWQQKCERLGDLTYGSYTGSHDQRRERYHCTREGQSGSPDGGGHDIGVTPSAPGWEMP